MHISFPSFELKSSQIVHCLVMCKYASNVNMFFKNKPKIIYIY